MSRDLTQPTISFCTDFQALLRILIFVVRPNSEIFFMINKMESSLLEGEILVDALEKDGKIRFRGFRKGTRYGTWNIHKKP
jgi:hypothetical protein